MQNTASILSMMASYVILFLRFFLLIATAPTVLTAPKFTTAPVCLPFLGQGINFKDCEEALHDFDTKKKQGGYHGNLFASTDPTDANRKLRAFGRNSDIVGKLHTLPLGSGWKTCSTGIDLVDPAPTYKAYAWNDLSAAIRHLLHECTRRSFVGGVLVHDGFEFIVANPHTGLVDDTCMAPPKPLGMSLRRCIAHRVGVNAAQAQSHAGPSAGQASLLSVAGRLAQEGSEDGSSRPLKRPRLGPNGQPSGLPPPAPDPTGPPALAIPSSSLI